MYALVDCNNFFASCERVFKPQFRNQPVVILSNNDGCVISRSDEAKALHVPMGAPEFKYRSFFKNNNIQVFSSNYPLYGDMSDRVMSILRQFSPDVEIYSIDEAFLHFDGFESCDFKQYGIDIHKRILQWTGLPTSVGIAPTKALSKIANKYARKHPKETENAFVIDTEAKRIHLLKNTPIQDVWGIGRRLSKRLISQQIYTAYDFIMLPDLWVKKRFSITEYALKKDLEGIPTLTLEDVHSKKSIATTRTFEGTYSDFEEVKERTATFAIQSSEKLRKQQSLCNGLIVLLRSDRHQPHLEQYRNSVHIPLPHPTNSSLTISNFAIKGLKSIFRKGIAYKRAGIILTGLVDENNYQLDFFNEPNPKHNNLMSTIDELNQKIGDYKIKIASQDLDRTWKMKQQHLSPRYTTKIEEILTVK